MYRFEPKGVCCETIDVDLEDDVVKYVKIYGGCDGNLNALCKMTAGQKVDHVAALLEGNTCHRHDDTSCADQMVKALRAAQSDAPRASAEGMGGKGLSRRQFAQVVSVGLATVLATGLPTQAFADASSRTFVDSLGREVSVPPSVGAVMPLGEIAQCLVCTLCPETLTSVASEIDETDEREYREAGMDEIAELPETGGGASSGVEDVEPQAAIWTGASIMLDAGLPKNGLADELDALQAEGDTPCVFLDTSFGNLPQAYRLLGDLLGRQGRAEELATYIEGAMARAASVRDANCGSCSVFYAPRKTGLEVKSSYTVQADAIAHIGAIPVTSPYVFPDRTVNLAAVDAANVDLVVFDDTDCLASLAAQEGPAWEAWGGVEAVAAGKVAVSPALIYSWFGSLAHVQSIGVLWLASVIWPSSCPYDIALEADTFYRLFYGLSKDEGELDGLVGLYDEKGYSNEG
ncbi:TIGR03905 family TSCPD domain-containing protein [Gordonibacter massiliensis (ex Traore et al. 2017)]|uniref:TIGR03905 family TSCPD domain-containing protein n=1 Tax=Gordonibacter massiliensis (ex Traore et al. 2017) TaxID=1841863 RepID=UPI001C8BFA28|nr:TIGR03905 family TSCPD domain-containing protein [Gordonibacter massiliensis (ex Traore et al. 2017)]MBX9035127.1 TIGR03905 family TSCPD domain-containing protein [Gordonibacter massiliensis (ex Traore et al. 2017)]